MSRNYFITHSQHQQLSKYQDELVCCPPDGARHFGLFAALDGHASDSAARYAAQHLQSQLFARLPPQPPAHPGDPAYAASMRRAVAASFVATAELFRRARRSGGSTATVAVVTGGLLTVASVGTSACVIDSGWHSEVVSVDHRIGTNDAETSRLSGGGAQIARLKFDLSGPAGADEEGCGPLRVWPGGLIMSRSLGDHDDAPTSLVLPFPHVVQLVLPQAGCRLILATDGVCSHFPPEKAPGLLRNVSIQNAASTLVQTALRKRRAAGAADDASALVVDLLPSSQYTYKALMGLVADFKQALAEEDGRELSQHGGGGGTGSRPAKAAADNVYGGLDLAVPCRLSLEDDPSKSSSSEGGGSNGDGAPGCFGCIRFGGGGGGGAGSATSVGSRSTGGLFGRGSLPRTPESSFKISGGKWSAPSGTYSGSLAQLPPLDEEAMRMEVVAMTDTYREYGGCDDFFRSALPDGAAELASGEQASGPGSGAHFDGGSPQVLADVDGSAVSAGAMEVQQPAVEG